jgi:hypothetical protein
MNGTLQATRNCALLIAAWLILPDTAVADYDEPSAKSMRGEMWLAVTSWPALGDLEPVVGGSFNAVGYGLGGALLWPLKSIAGMNLFVGVEGAVMATESDIPVLLDELLARDGYVAVSAKWKVGDARRVSVDMGVAYHLLDITQLETDYNSSAEFESWEEAAVGAFLGMTWDLGSSDRGTQRGITLGLRAHFIDFGKVHDEDVLASVVLGRDAGELDGPLFALQLGYRWR